MTELLILCMQFECQRAGIELPWDAIALRLASEKNSSGASIVQHLAKRRKELLESGCWVPPLLKRRNALASHDIRGIVKTGPGPKDLRYVSW